MKSQYTKILTLALTVQVACAPLMASAAMFADTQTNWAKNAIQTLSDQNIITGYPDSTFRPAGLITRAEFSAVMVKALGLNAQASGQQTFGDVSTSHWAYPAIETVRGTGLVSGYPNGLFLPNKSISRAETMAVLANAARIPMSNDTTVNQVLSGYRDAASIPAWARAGVAAVIQSGIYANDPVEGNIINPLQPATRADVAAMVQNLRERSGYAGTRNGQTSASNQVLQAHIATVPANTKFTGTLTNGVISSEVNKVGEEITLDVDQPLVSSDGRVLIPVGSKIIGKISKVEASGNTGKNASLNIDFTELRTPDNQRYGIQGSVATEDGLLHGGTTKGRIIKALEATAMGAGVGAALGTAMGPLSGGHVGKGAVYGTVLGAGVGALGAAMQKGKDVTISSGDKVEIKLNQPLNVQVNQ